MTAAAHPHDHDQIVVPRPVIWLTIALVLFCIAAIASARLLQLGVTHEDALAPRREASFRIIQSLKGPVIAVRPDGSRVMLVAANEEKLPRLILRSVGAIRARDGADQSAPVRLVELGDGQRLIVDPATHRTLRLAAFGAGNQHVFDALLPGGAR